MIQQTDVFDVYYYPLADEEFPHWVIHKSLGFFPHLSDHLAFNDAVVYRDIEELSNIKGKDVLIIGGGPSSHTLTDDIIEQYDILVSMNNFFKNNYFKTKKIDIVAVGAGVNLTDADFLAYLSKFEPIIAFELHPHWRTMTRSLMTYYKTHKTIFFQTNFYGKVGVGIRLVTLMAELRAKSISFIGFDGPEPILRGEHAFEKGKTQLPSFCTKENADDVHREHYELYWKYITELYPTTKFISIDKENEYHEYVS